MSKGADTAPAPVVADPARIRNVVLVGHSGAGKTTLVEALARTAGVPAPEADEHALTLLALLHRDTKLNLLDAPGYADFVGELRAGLRAADAALFVVSAVDGLDPATQLLWEECAAVGMPRAVVVTKLDKERADFDEAVAICQRVFGDGVLPLHVPLLSDEGDVAGLYELLAQQVVDYSSGRAVRPAEHEHVDATVDARGALLEGIIAESEDETLMDRYLAGEEIDLALLTEDLEKAVARGAFYPVLAASPTAGVGLVELLDLVVAAFPTPAEHPMPAVWTPVGAPKDPLVCDPAGPLVAEVVKTVSDPYVGRTSLVRVFSGTLLPDTPVHVSGHAATFFGANAGHADHDVDERVGALSVPSGKQQRPVPSAVAGDIVAVSKLSRAETGDTLSSKEDPALVEPWTMPEPMLPVAISARARADEDKLAAALGRLVAEDPTLRLEQTAQTVLWCMGEAHRDAVLGKLSGRYGVSVDTEPVRVSLRETFASTSKGHGRHVKQSGGHGQFAVCDIEVEPLPSGAGLEFVDKVVGGAVPRQFIPSVEKGVRAAMERGLVSGYPVVDIRVTLVDGKAHAVDSSDAAFQIAGSLALKDAATNGSMALLEPVDLVTVTVPDEYVGPVMSDLSGRRGRVLGQSPVDGGRTEISAEVPAQEVTAYAVDLRSLSHGGGTFTREYARHEPMPGQLAAKLLG
ncbi:translation elongation factor 2 (EF-2/EF-G) [Motilibacter rhizosphaerae]|uniref:Elongation factor G-like protein n=1 Tax=Motilibacter rhizosphaerae TaxID=598652 RepID=A0A4V2F4I6_9ACTN|nr:elongation factor G-like protein EF-G2 [Motilibacter rhizosphaerae]RZS89449.1 translation elongation factor 2 (EF-2/EF-G) [Motilibacter rhizosphaerae]